VVSTRRQWMVGLAALASCRGARRMRVLVVDEGLASMPFWVALGTRGFADQALDIELLWAESAGAAVRGLLAARAELAMAPPSVGVELMARDFPFRYVANLLHREPACLIAHYASVTEPIPTALRERLERLRGLRLGVAVEDEGRLEVLFHEGGLDLREVVTLHRLSRDHHSVALAAKRVDALFTRSPQLEKSLLYSRAVLVVAPPRGEVDGLADLQVASALAHPEATERRGSSVGAFLRALQAGANVCRNDPERAVAALLEVMPGRNPTELGPAVELYAAAIPSDLEPTAEAVARTAALYPAAAPIPEPSEVQAHVDPRFARAAAVPRPHHDRLLPPLVAMTAAGALGAWRGRRRGQSSPG